MHGHFGKVDQQSRSDVTGQRARGIHCYAWRMASAFRYLHAFHVVLQLIEALIPDRALRHHPVFSGCERLWCKMIAANAPFLARSHHAAFLEHRKMLRKGRQGHVEWTCQLRGRGRSPGQPLDHSAPGRVRECLKNAADLLASRRRSPIHGCPSAGVSAHAGTDPIYRVFDIPVRRLRSRWCRRVAPWSGVAAGA